MCGTKSPEFICHVTGARCSAPPGRSTQTTRDVLRKRPRPWIKPRAWALHFIPSRFIPGPSTRQARSQRLPGGRCERWAHEESAGYRHLFELLVGSKILYERNRVGIFRLWIDHSVDPADGARHAFELAFAQFSSVHDTTREPSKNRAGGDGGGRRPTVGKSRPDRTGAQRAPATRSQLHT